jgi:sec-independent protein translocase protein TatB
MLDIGSSELLVIVVVAILVIGPKDLPRALYTIGRYLGKARAMTRHFRSGIDEMVRQAELEDLEKKWAAENARIMAQHPPAPPADEATASIEAQPTGADLTAVESGPVEVPAPPSGGREQA